MKWHNAQQTWADRADRAVHNSRKKARYWEDPEAARERMRAWREANPELQREIEKRSESKNAIERRKQRGEWRERNREHLNDRSKLFHYQTRTETPWKHILRSAFRRANERELPFSLSPEWAKKAWTGRCALTDIEFQFTPFPSFYSPSIDRIIPALGYTPDNSRFILLSLNAFKNTATDEEMFATARLLLSRQVVTSELVAAQVVSPET